MKHIIRLFILIAALVLGTDHTWADVVLRVSNPRVKFVYVDGDNYSSESEKGFAFASDADNDGKVTITMTINEGQDYRCIEGDLTAEQSINSGYAEVRRRAPGKGVPVPLHYSKTNEFTFTLPEDQKTNVTIYVKFSEKDSFTPVVSIENWIYGEAAKTPTITGNTSGGAVTYTYSDAEDGTYSTTVPTLAGPHYVKATVAATADYKACESAPKAFTISQKSITIASVNVEDKVYDGTTSATLSGTFSFHDGMIVEGDDVSINASGASAVFDDKDVGSGKSVTVTGLALSGTDMNNYVLTNSTFTTTANITKKDLIITAKYHSILYGNAAANNGVTYSGFVNGEDESVLEGTLTYTYKNDKGDYGEGNDAPSYYQNTPYQITPKGLTSNNYEITFVPGVLDVAPVHVSVRVVDKADGEKIETASVTVQVLDNGNQVTVCEFGFDTDINDLKAGKTYTLRETKAPEGYVLPSDLTFTIDNEGKITTTNGTMTQEGVLLVENTKTHVEISVVDKVNGAALAEATVQVIEKTGESTETVAEEWTSTTENHIIEGLKTGVEYTLHEENVPSGYTAPADYTFTIAPNGSITFTGNKTNEGVLLVENTPQVTVTITGHSNTGEIIYDGQEKTVTGYDVVISNSLYTEAYFTFSGTAEAKGTDARTYNMGLTAENFSNTNENFDVTFDVTDGFLTINPKAVTVKADDKSKEFGTDDPELTATVTGVIEGEDASTLINYTISRAEGNDVGDYVITPTGETTQGNYTVTYETGTFTIFVRKNIATFPEADIIVPDQTLGTYTAINYKFEAANSGYTSTGTIVKDGDTPLELGTDYVFGSVTRKDNGEITDAGIGDECLVEIVGKGNYTGKVTREFKIVAPDANGIWGDLTWAFHDGTLTISGTGAMNATEDNYPWRSIASYVETITIGDGITSIAANAFAGTQDENPYSSVTTISLPSTLTTIGNNAFAYCTGATITVPTSVTTLGSNPFNEVGCVVVSKPLVDGHDNSDIISKMSCAQSATFTYKRSFTANVASTVCLPFAHTPGTGEGTYYTFTAINKTTSPWTVTMTATAASLTANTPYMFMPAVDAVSFNGTALSFDPTSTYSSDVVYDPVVAEGKWNLIGTYESRLWDDTHNNEEIGSVYGFAAKDYNGDGYTVNPGDFVKAMAGASIAPFRAYLKYTPGSSAPNRRAADEEVLPSRLSVRLVNAEGIVTAIGTMDTNTGEVRFDSDAWYSIDGSRLNGKPAQKGVYINNGKKIIIK